MDFRLRVLGIDPGNYITGYGIVERNVRNIQYISHGEIKSLRTALHSMCLKNVYNQLIEIIKKTTPDVVAVENIFYGKNVKSLTKLGEVRGVAILAASQNGLPIYEYTPLQVKKAVVGYGQAEKIQVQKMVKVILNLPDLPSEDAADAMAVAICHINYMKEIPV